MTAARASQGLALVLDYDRQEAAEWRRHGSEPSAQTRSALFDRYHPHASTIALAEWKKIAGLGLDRADALQICSEELLKAIERFDPKRGVPFEGYIRRRIAGALKNALAKATESAAIYNCRKRMERERVHSLKQMALTNEDEPLEVIRELATSLAIGFLLETVDGDGVEDVPALDPSAYEAISWKQILRELDSRITGLPERERLVIEYHYKRDIRFCDIATILGVSKGRVSQLHAQGVGRLRKSLSKFR